MSSQQSIGISTISNGMSGNAMMYIDQMLMFQSISMMQSIFDKKAFTFQNIVLIFMLVSFDPLRKMIIKIFELIDIITSVKWLYDTITYRKKQNIIMNEYKHDITPYKTMSFTPSISFWECVMSDDYKNNEDCTIQYTKTDDISIVQKNMYEYKITETYSNISFHHPKFKAHFKESFNVVKSMINGNTKIESISKTASSSNLREYHNTKSFSDLLPFPVFANEFRKVVEISQCKFLSEIRESYQEYMNQNGGVTEKSICEFFKSSSKCKFNINNTSYDCIYVYADSHISVTHSSAVLEFYLSMIPSLLEKYPEWDYCLGIYEFMYICSIIDSYIELLRIQKKPYWTPRANVLFGCDVSSTIENLKKYRSSLSHIVWYAHIYKSYSEKLPDYEAVTKFLLAQFFPEVYSLQELPEIKKNIMDEKNTNEVILYGDVSAWVSYIQGISSSNVSKSLSTTNNENQVYILKIVEEVTTETVNNPAYEEWEQYISKLKELQQGNSSISIPQPPPKTNIIEKKTSKLVTEHINSVKKDMRNLYLRQEDKQKLMNCLLQYKENKELMQELGIPNKLGILLYGEPGTGKSSTIQAIASFLQKNIYYVQMNEIRTNEQLYMLFNYVTKKSTSGGIIVMEDIDAMTEVVHARNNNYKIQKEAVNDAEQLTLEFFLNILQGSLTSDDTIFITTTNHIEVLDPAFYRDGRFDVKIEMKAANHHQIKEIFQRFFNRVPSHDILYRIPDFKYTPATIISHFRTFLLEPNVSDDSILERFIDI